MSLNDVAQWLGYGVMLVGGVLLVVLMLLVVSLVLSAKINLIGKYLRFHWDLKTLRQTMRQLEVDGKVSKQKGVRP